MSAAKRSKRPSAFAWRRWRVTCRAIYSRLLRKRAGCAISLSSLSPSWSAGSAFALLRAPFPQELTPPEDRAVALVRMISAPQGVSLDYTRSRKMTEIERLVSPLQRQRRSAEHLCHRRDAADPSNNGFMVLTLAPWGEREPVTGRHRGRTQPCHLPPCRACVPLPSSPTAWAFAVPATACSSPSSATATTNWPAVGRADGRKARTGSTLPPDQACPTRPPSRRSRSRSTATRASDLGVNIDGLAEALQALLGRSARWRRCSSRTARIPVKLLSTNNPDQRSDRP
jgi:HAE1 family hydrophobic/amphiphilic exporter-1